MKIISLDRQAYQGVVLHFNYTTDAYYDVLVEPQELFSVRLVKKQFPNPINKSFTGALFPDHLEDAHVFAAVDDNEQIVGYLEVGLEPWHQRLRLSEILVVEHARGQGVGTLLMNTAHEFAQACGCREVVLETQTCNVPAINFYFQHHYRVIGIDLTHYSNEDIANQEVRLEMVRSVISKITSK